MSTPISAECEDIPTAQWVRWGGFGLGIAAFIALLMAPVPEGMSPLGWKVIALASLMVIWWVAEAVPLAVTALLPLLALPLLDVYGLKYAAVPYASPVIFLFIGGFMLGIAMEKWGLHRRIALHILHYTHGSPGLIIAGFMIATAFVSLWISNTATMLMMLPMVTGVLRSLDISLSGRTDMRKAHHYFATALLLGVAYAASIGGVGTLLGSPSNMILKGYMEQSFGIKIEFLDWLAIGLPFAGLMLVATWVLLVKVLFRCAKLDTSCVARMVADERKNLGKMLAGERWVTVIFLLTVAAWVGRPQLEEWAGVSINDTLIVLVAAFILFIIPLNPRTGEMLMNWQDAERLPVGVMLLFGGGLSLAGAISETGVAAYIGEQLRLLEGLHVFAVILLVALLMIALTEVMSNVAVLTAFLPIVGALAVGLEINPLLLALPATVAASCGFIMPSGSMPNAIVFSHGALRARDMAKAGIILNVVAVIIIALLTYYVMPGAFGFSL